MGRVSPNPLATSLSWAIPKWSIRFCLTLSALLWDSSRFWLPSLRCQHSPGTNLFWWTVLINDLSIHFSKNVAESTGSAYLMIIKQFFTPKYSLWYSSFSLETKKLYNCSKLNWKNYLAHYLLIDFYTMLSTNLHNLETQWHYLPSVSKTPRKIKAIRILYKTFPNVIALFILLTALVLVHLLS